MDETVESFTLDDIEEEEIEQVAQFPITDDISVCSCRGMCLRDSGRNACPCKSLGKFCSSVCHNSVDNANACMNKRRILESESSPSSDQSNDNDPDFHVETPLDTSNHDSMDEGIEEARPTRGQARTSRRPAQQERLVRGRTRGRNRGRGRSRTRQGLSRAEQRETNERGRGTRGRRARGRAARGRATRGRATRRRRGRGRLVVEENAEERRVAHENRIQNLVENLEIDVLQRLAIELLRRQPAVFDDLVNGEIRGIQAMEPALVLPQPADNECPDWCKCGRCRIMPTQEENKCCCTTEMLCITTQPLFQQLILDGNVLDIAMRYREDVLALDHPRNNENFRHTAYRQFVLWQHGKLGQGNRRVVPSCCVLAIRSRYPSQNGMYVGFRPGRL